MSWTNEKDVVLMRQMISCGIFDTKSGSRERGNLWMTVALELNQHTLFDGQLKARGARDRFTLLSKKMKVQNTKELKTTGGGGQEQTELELLVEEIMELSEESDKKFQEISESDKKKADAEKQIAQDVRKQAMERMGETRTRLRKDSDDDGKEGKKRRKGADTLDWLEKKGKVDAEWRRTQLEEQKAERQMMREERQEELQMQRMQLQAQIEAQQQKQQQQQSLLMQQMIGLMQQQQQQFQAWFSK